MTITPAKVARAPHPAPVVLRLDWHVEGPVAWAYDEGGGYLGRVQAVSVSGVREQQVMFERAVGA